MPIYEYRCSACEAQFDQLVRSGEEPSCPFCESPELERRMSAAAVSGGFKSTASSPSVNRASGGGCCGGGCGCR